MFLKDMSDKMKLNIIKICLIALTIGGLVFLYDTFKAGKKAIKLEQHDLYILPEVIIDG